jgi:mono/diheme cytochrome c family protein
MLKHLSLVAAAALLVLAAGYADQTRGKVVISAGRTDATDGKMMYQSYCAPCHGVDGRGHGPAAQALKTQPVDLTTLARTHRGKYPDTHVVSVLQFGVNVPAHGSAEMPVWGPILAKVDTVHVQERSLRIANLTRFLESIQAK